MVQPSLGIGFTGLIGIAATSAVGPDPVNWIERFGIAGLTIVILLAQLYRAQKTLDTVQEQVRKDQHETNAVLAKMTDDHNTVMMEIARAQNRLAEVLDRRLKE